MKFSGLQKVSLIDYPNKVASVLFTPGCNLRCPFCHNWRIVKDPKPPFIQEAVVLRILENRKKYVDAVVITGGEPTMHKELPKFLAKLKKRGFQVKLDTNGFYPQVLEKCLGYVDYVALDIKTSPEKYKLLGAENITGLLRTVDLLKMGEVEYEFRTTMVPEIITVEDVNKIQDIIKGAKIHVFQQFVPHDTMDKRFEDVKPYTTEVIKEFAGTMKNYAENVEVRI